MEITQEFLVQGIVWILGGLAVVATVFFTLVVVMWRHLNSMGLRMGDKIDARLRSLGHEDTNIRGQVNAVMTFLVEHLENEAKGKLEEENTRLKWIIKTMKPNIDPDPVDTNLEAGKIYGGRT